MYKFNAVLKVPLGTSRPEIKKKPTKKTKQKKKPTKKQNGQSNTQKSKI